MNIRRQVRVSDAFFAQLDSQLGSGRGPSGKPSATDYLVMELPAIVERFSASFDELPRIVEGVSAGRMLITTGVLVSASVVYGLDIGSGVVELVGIELELGTA